MQEMNGKSWVNLSLENTHEGDGIEALVTFINCDTQDD